MSTLRVRNTIIECMTGAKSDSEHLQLKALEMISSITKVSPQNRNLIAETHTCVPTILSLTKSSNPFIQSLSFSILFNLSLNPNLKHSLADIKTIHHLNSMIFSSPELNRAVSSLICSLAMLDKNKAKFGVAGTIQVSIKAISHSGSGNVASHHLLSSLAELVQFHGNCTLAVRANAVDILIELIKQPDEEDLTGTALGILSLLARFNEGLSALKKTQCIVTTMVDVLKGRCMLGKEGATEILLRLFDESDECLREAMGVADQLLPVLADLSVRGSFRAREKSGLLMTKMMMDLDHFQW
ncbi:unnamed protein product [Rhodiola kirilowii]